MHYVGMLSYQFTYPCFMSGPTILLSIQVLERDGYACRGCGASGRRKRSIVVNHLPQTAPGPI